MGNSIGKIFTVILAVLLLFIAPITHMFDQQDQTSRIYVLTETSQLVDAVRNTGRLTPEMVEVFYQQLSATRNIYDVSFEHRHQKYDPIYDDPLDPATFQEDYSLHYSNYYTADLMAVLFPETGVGKAYDFSTGDYFLVCVKNKRETIGTKVKQLLYGVHLPKETIVVRYGGMIK